MSNKDEPETDLEGWTRVIREQGEQSRQDPDKGELIRDTEKNSPWQRARGNAARHMTSHDVKTMFDTIDKLSDEGTVLFAKRNRRMCIEFRKGTEGTESFRWRSVPLPGKPDVRALADAVRVMSESIDDIVPGRYSAV